MTDYFCISVSFLDRRFHGCCDGGHPEWPPSPLRLMQAMIAASARQMETDDSLNKALLWLEEQPAPLIIAPEHSIGAPCCLSVPNNALDLVGKAWSRGSYFGSGDANPATHRTMKTVRPVVLNGGDTVRYLWKIPDPWRGSDALLPPLMKAADRIYALGWGIDLVVGHGDRIPSTRLPQLPGERWLPAGSTGRTTLRVPVRGTFAAVRSRYRGFIERVGKEGFLPVKPLTQFQNTGYRRLGDPVPRPCVVFELRHDDGAFCVYSQRRLVHVAGMVRHLAKKLMLRFPPPDVDQDWVERYVVGHQDRNVPDHRQLSYLPLPSLGHLHSDQAVRRIMITAPRGDEAWLEHLARRLEGQQLEPEFGNEFGGQGAPSLLRVYHDRVARCYTQPANRWASVTPIILPGHDDRKPAKTRKLIETALAQSGMELPCTYEWSAFSRFRKSHSAHKYDKNGRPGGYIRPDHLNSQTAVHLTIEFDNRAEVAGPLAIGAGRHCGFGVLGVFSAET